MTLMTPGEWFSRIVEPNYRECRASPNDERRALNAILAIHHFWDRVYHYYDQTDRTKLLGARSQTEFMLLLIKKHGDEIEILNDVANALKHHFLTRRNLGRDIDELWVTTATGSFYQPTSAEAEGELEIADTGRAVKGVLAAAIGNCRLWCH